MPIPFRSPQLMPMMGLMICCISKIVYKSNEFMVIGPEDRLDRADKANNTVVEIS
jgi:hypothetical protein